MPRSAVSQDQQGSFVYAVDEAKKVVVRRVQLGAAQGTLVLVSGGLKEGESVIVEGIQRVRPGIEVNPAPVGGPPGGVPPAPKPAG